MGMENDKKIWCMVALVVFIILIICMYLSCSKSRRTLSQERIYFPAHVSNRCGVERFAPNISGLNVVEDNSREKFSGFSINK